MFTQSLLPQPFFLISIVFFICVAVVVVFALVFKNRFEAEQDDEEEKESPYEKKPFVFDTLDELTTYRLLLEAVGDQFYIFPQIPYARLIQVKKGFEKQKRNTFDKKIVDFVLCDKERAVAKLAIELDGASHQNERTQVKDAKKDEMFRQVGLPLLRIKTGEFNKDSLKALVESKLQKTEVTNSKN